MSQSNFDPFTLIRANNLPCYFLGIKAILNKILQPAFSPMNIWSYTESLFYFSFCFKERDIGSISKI